MKIQVLYNDADGAIIGIRHPSSAPPGAPQPIVAFTPQPGHSVAELDVPPELTHLNRARLHAALRVDTTGQTPRLVAVQ
jgi:hypothetical protein